MRAYALPTTRAAHYDSPFQGEEPMQMKKTVLALALAVAAAGAYADTLKKVADSGKLTLAYRESSVPFSYEVGAGKPAGLAVEMSEAIAAEVKRVVGKPVDVSWQSVTSANRIPLLVNGTIDLECGSTTNNSTRGKDVQFAINHFYTGTRLLTKKTSGVQNYADLAKKTVASTTGTTNAQVIRKYSADKNLDMQLILGKDHDDSLLLVESDRALAFAMDDILLFGLMANSKNPASLQVVGDS